MSSCRPHIPWLAVAFCALTGALAPCPAPAQSLLDGFWNVVYDEDFVERVPGADQGEYAGLPLTPAAVSIAHTWDPASLTIPERQCEPMPALIGFREVGNLRIWEDRDPATNTQTQIETWIMWLQQHRHIWMVPHPHPPPWAPESWQGFSSGKWVGNVLEVHTDMIRDAWIRRNGVPSDDRATMDERFFRYGDILTHISMVTDSQYLSEPLVKSDEFYRAAHGSMDPYPCTPADEVPRAEGLVPMHLPGFNPVWEEQAVRTGVPVQASLDGARTMFPEYQDYMKTLPPNPSLPQIEKAEQKLARQGRQ